MASPEFHFDTRIQRHHVSLLTQQHRLHHLRSVVARNIEQKDDSGLYFSLHCNPDSFAFYTSEVISGNLNPTWKDLESSMFHEPANPASSFVTIKLWNFSEMLVEWVVFFCGLHYLGKQISKEGKNFEKNTLIFGMYEGFYGCKNCPQHSLNESDCPPEPSICVDISALMISCELSTLERMKTIERAMKQTQKTAYRRRQKIEKKLQAVKRLHMIYAHRENYKIKLCMLQEEVQQQNMEYCALERKVTSSEEVLKRSQLELKQKQEELNKSKEKVMGSWKKFCNFRETLLKTSAQLAFRKTQLVSDLYSIYPMIEFPDCKGFSIHNVYLPNSENFYGHDDTMIGIALGYVCHFVLMISQFLNVPIRYSMQFGGSRSTITDHISTMIPMKIKEFPLFLKGKDRRLFEYAVYLLNKNIAQIRISCGLMTKDLTATLPNLSSLIESRSTLNESYSNQARLLGLSKVVISDSISTNDLLQRSYDLRLKDNRLFSIDCSEVNEELECLKREMAQMTPSNQTNSMLSSWSTEICKEQSCSLDKGLNDIKVFENSVSHEIHDNLMLKNGNFKLGKVNQDVHHSSYPNLNLCLHLNVDSALLAHENEFQSSTLKIWKTESSRGNSEEETFDENAESTAFSDLELQDSCFCIVPYESKDKEYATISNGTINKNDDGNDLIFKTINT